MSLYDFDICLGIMLYLLVELKLPYRLFKSFQDAICICRVGFSWGYAWRDRWIPSSLLRPAVVGRWHTWPGHCSGFWRTASQEQTEVCCSIQQLRLWKQKSYTSVCFGRNILLMLLQMLGNCRGLRQRMFAAEGCFAPSHFVNRKPGRLCLMVTRRMVLHVAWPIRHWRMAMLTWMDLVTKVASFIHVISKNLILVLWTMLFLYFVGMWTDHGRGTWVIAGCRWTSAAGGGLEGGLQRRRCRQSAEDSAECSAPKSLATWVLPNTLHFAGFAARSRF